MPSGHAEECCSRLWITGVRYTVVGSRARGGLIVSGFRPSLFALAARHHNGCRHIRQCHNCLDIEVPQAPLRKDGGLGGDMSGSFTDSLIPGSDDSLVYLGTRPVYGGSQRIGLSRVDRRQHLYVIGKTGTGKSTLLRNLILQDMYGDCGVGVIDPHGDLARDLLDHVPPWRTNHVLYFDPADLQHPIGLNLLANVPPDRRHRVASGLVGAMKAIWADSWGPRLEYILYAAIAALLDCENASILGLQRMLVDARYRKWVVKQVKDPIVRAFWQRWKRESNRGPVRGIVKRMARAEKGATATGRWLG